MADNSWKNLELWERVKWARARRFESAVSAAEALGMQPGTYRKGGAGMRIQYAIVDSPLGKLMLQAMRFMDERPRVPQKSGTRVSAQEVARRATLSDEAPGMSLIEEVVKTNDPRRETDSDRPTIPFLGGVRR